MRGVILAACGTGFLMIMTTLGAALVFLFNRCVSERMNRLCLGFAGGVMSAATVFSLLLPALERAAKDTAWLVIATGFAVGTGTMLLLGRVLDKRQRAATAEARRMALLFSAVTLHNIPEGMAVGLAFALAAAEGAALPAGACALALGIGIQNYPEGAAISLPLRQSGMSRMRSFALGTLSGAVEPLFGVAAAFAVGAMTPALPGLMAFAAGAMMWVVITEMLPHAAAQQDGALAAAVGYLVMMTLDVALG